jgi:hypothetical protein
MLRTYLLQQWYDITDPAMDDALIEVATMRRGKHQQSSPLGVLLLIPIQTYSEILVMSSRLGIMCPSIQGQQPRIKRPKAWGSSDVSPVPRRWGFCMLRQGLD